LFGARLRICDPQTGVMVHSLLDRRYPVYQVAFSPNGLDLASAGHDGLVIVWQLYYGLELFRLRGHAGTVEDVTYDPTGRRLASCDSTGCVFVWDAAAQEASVHHWRTGTRNAVSADGCCLADGSIKVPLRVCDATTGAEIAQRIPLTEDGQLYLSPSGDQV